MSPELTFLLTLGFRMAITAAFVVSASVITERSGPVIGALVATLPISAGPSYVFLALAICVSWNLGLWWWSRRRVQKA